jgi:hypothetical protein
VEAIRTEEAGRLANHRLLHNKVISMKPLYWILLRTVVIIIGISLPVSLACSGREKPSPTSTSENEPIVAEPAPQPGPEEAPIISGEPDDYSLEGFVDNWPDDVPLMEPHTIESFLPEHGGYKQVTILVEASLSDAYDFYADNLFEKEGWEPVEDSKSGVPGLFLSYKCRKDNRELGVMMKSENEGKITLIQLGLTDLTKYKKKSD